MSGGFRLSGQRLLPARLGARDGQGYDLYPTHDLAAGSIEVGFERLARRLAAERRIVLDGDVGVLWEDLRQRLDQALRGQGVQARWVDVGRALRDGPELERLLAPFLGGEDPLFGRRCTLDLGDLLEPGRLAELSRAAGDGTTIWYGSGAALCRDDAWLVYADLPRNELQYRARAGRVANLGLREPLLPKAAYKRSYFVDWPLLEAHRKRLAGRLDLLVDAQRPDEPAALDGPGLRATLSALGRSSFRARPWFEAGPWGGQWCRRHIRDLPEAPNYAWSFELITPENGLLLRDGEQVLEASFDWLMHVAGQAVLGRHAPRFGDQFPIRFDFLDTVEGGNLSIQVHPGAGYMAREFGERLAQDECYYILDAAPDARVNLGLQDGVDPQDLRAALERSAREAAPLDVGRWVQSHPSRRHDLFLVPHGTIHGSGAGNLVLEISSTPYIYTFKLYDWLRPDLDGRPRPLNLARGLECLDPSRAGARVAEELVSRPRPLARGEGWGLELLPTHPDHFYEVLRHRFVREARASTEEGPHVLSLVEGTAVALETSDGTRRVFHFAETFVVPAAARGYRLVNLGRAPAVVVAARLKAVQ